MNSGEIEDHLANLIQKDARTVRRYLKLTSIKNKDIIEAVHDGYITPTTALDFGKKDHDKDEIAAMLPHRPWEEPMILPFGKNYTGPGIANMGAAVQVGKLHKD